MYSELTKLDVARHQLITAISLFFDDGDAISIYSLASNAWEIIDVLCNREGIDSFSNDTRDHLPKNKDLKKDYINNPYRNFFKHADTDPNDTLTGFSDKQNDGLIFTAVEDYIRLEKTSPIEFQVFQLWYLATNNEKISSKELNEVMEVIKVAFPNIEKLSRKNKKKMGKSVLKQELQTQPRNKENS